MFLIKKQGEWSLGNNVNAELSTPQSPHTFEHTQFQIYTFIYIHVKGLSRSLM